MTLDTTLAVLSNVLTVGFSLYAIKDNRRLRSERQSAVIAARTTIDRVYGTLIGIKAPVIKADSTLKEAINNALAAIDGQRAGLERL